MITSVARDDVADGGAAIFAETVAAIRRRNPQTTVDRPIPDCKGAPDVLATMDAWLGPTC